MRINARRAAHGEQALKSLEELKADEEPDANLGESAEILVDLGAALHAGPARLSRTELRHD